MNLSPMDAVRVGNELDILLGRQSMKLSLIKEKLDIVNYIKDGYETEAFQQRKVNLQYAAIALALVILSTIFLFITHSVLGNQKLIKFTGVLGLLIFFEFLNLLLHPYLEQLTHHSPLIMLVIMVSIAAVLIPFHHKIEHTVTTRMIERNNKIRVAAAKKILAMQQEGISEEEHSLATEVSNGHKH